MPRFHRWLLFDGGDTLMRVFPEYKGKMCAWPHVAAVPGVEQALATLRSDWQLAIATNAADSDEADIRAAMARVHLDIYFDRIYCYRRIGYKKPSPEFFAWVLDDLKVASAEAIMIGDEFDADVQGALRAGLRALWFNERSAEERRGPGYATFHNFASLPGLLASAFADSSAG